MIKVNVYNLLRSIDILRLDIWLNIQNPMVNDFNSILH